MREWTTCKTVIIRSELKSWIELYLSESLFVKKKIKRIKLIRRFYNAVQPVYIKVHTLPEGRDLKFYGGFVEVSKETSTMSEEETSTSISVESTQSKCRSQLPAQEVRNQEKDLLKWKKEKVI